MAATLHKFPSNPGSADTLGRRERKKLALRAKLVEECQALIGERGVEGTTVEALCERVDISKKTFYNYFESKNALVVEICQTQLMAGLEAMITLAESSSSVCGEQIDLIFKTLFESQIDLQRLDLELIDYMVSNFGTNRGVSVGLLDEMNQMFVNFFRRHEDVLRPKYTPRFCGEMTVGMINGVLLNWMNHREALDMQKALDVCEFIKTSMLKKQGE